VKSSRAPISNIIKARLKQPVIFDGRNLFEPKDIQALGIEYHGIGLSCSNCRMRCGQKEHKTSP